MSDQDLTEAQSVVLNDKLAALDDVNAKQANVNTQIVVAINQQRLMLNAIVKALAENGIEVDVPEFDEVEG